jgi:hypothetical protein
MFYDMLRNDSWNIGIVRKPISNFLRNDPHLEISWFRIFNDRYKFLSDPFGIRKGKTLYVFCEEFDYRAFKGRIVCIRLEDSQIHPPKAVIEFPFHTSYPYLFENDGRVYCVPETRQAREIAVYSADNFPQTWRKIATLVHDFPGVDPTVFQYDGYWWLTSAVQGRSGYRLFVWYATHPLGPWHAHEGNPVKENMSSTRPAGTPFVYENDLYRPAQDCSKTYGGRVVLNRVTSLTRSVFREEIAATVGPSTDDYFPHGLHTLSAVADITLVDGKRFIFSATATMRKILHTAISAFASKTR